MNVQSINNFSYNRIHNQKQKTTTPNFKGALSPNEYKLILGRLKKVKSEVIESFSVDKFKKVIENLTKRYESLGVRSVAIQIISKNDLPEFLGEQEDKVSMADKLGLCVAVGNNNGPIENMTNIYDAKTFLINQEDLAKI